MLHTEDLQIFGTTVQNLVAMVSWCPGFVHPLSAKTKEPSTMLVQNIVTVRRAVSETNAHNLVNC